MTDSSVGTSEVVADGNPQVEPDVSTNGTNNSSGEASQSATTQDSFIPEGVDVNTLPPSVRAVVEKINKDMVRGFTEKTSKLSETIKSEAAKATEAYKSKAEIYDQIAAQEEFVKQWNEYVQKSQVKGENPQNPGDPVLTEMKAKLDEMNQKIQMTEMAQITDAFAEAVNEKGEKLHADFDTLNEIMIGEWTDGQEKEPFSLLRASVELAPGKSPQEKLANGYKMAKQVRDAIFEEGRKAGMGRVQQKVSNGTNPPSHSIGDTLSVTEKRPKNAAEALALARKGTIVSRD